MMYQWDLMTTPNNWWNSEKIGDINSLCSLLYRNIHVLYMYKVIFFEVKFQYCCLFKNSSNRVMMISSVFSTISTLDTSLHQTYLIMPALVMIWSVISENAATIIINARISTQYPALNINIFHIFRQLYPLILYYHMYIHIIHLFHQYILGTISKINRDKCSTVVFTIHHMISISLMDKHGLHEAALLRWVETNISITTVVWIDFVTRYTENNGRST